jgi:hypothetical protein
MQYLPAYFQPGGDFARLTCLIHAQKHLLPEEADEKDNHAQEY